MAHHPLSLRHNQFTRYQFVTLLSWALVPIIALFIGCSSDEAINPPLPATPESLARGEELVEGLGACGFCHSASGRRGAALSGGRVFVDQDGEVQGSNITLAATGLRGWRESDMVKSFRGFTRPDESSISRQLHGGFEWLSDYDISAITAYLRTVRPVENEVPRRAADLIPFNPLAIFRSSKEVKGFIPAIGAKYPAAYGQYLADHVARCSTCHNSASSLITSEEYWAGGREVSIDGEVKIAPNITTSKVSGIGEWSEKDIKGFLRTGALPDGRTVDARFCPVEFYRTASDTDISALVSYIRSVPPVE